jgi:hypothetical protein
VSNERPGPLVLLVAEVRLEEKYGYRRAAVLGQPPSHPLRRLPDTPAVRQPDWPPPTMINIGRSGRLAQRMHAERGDPLVPAAEPQSVVPSVVPSVVLVAILS